MSTIDNFSDLQPPSVAGAPPPRRRRRRGRSTRRLRSSQPTSEPTAAATDGGSSLGLSDSDAPSSSARIDSSVAGDECGSSGIFSYNHSRIVSSSDEIDLESGEVEMKLHCAGESESEKQCRICHLKVEIWGGDTAEYDGDGGGDGGVGGGGIELGCNCKGDLGDAHKQCAETWFKIKGNMICEICGAAAKNVGGDQTHETTHTATETEPVDRSATGPIMVPSEPRTFLQGRRIMNILLGCMVFAFIISWLFHFNVLP